MVRLMNLLEEDGVEVDERRFKTSTGIDGLSEPFVGIIATFDFSYWIDYFHFQDPEYRIYVVAMYSSNARQLMCRVCCTIIILSI